MDMFDQIMSQIREKDAIDLVRSLIAIPSITGSERAIADFLSAELIKIGLSVEYLDAGEGRPNLIAHVEADRNDSGLILIGHMDTVPVAKGTSKSWEVDPFNGDLKNGCIYGLGSSDMKGGIASILLAVKAIQVSREKLKRGLTIILSVDEEHGSKSGMQYVCKQRKITGNLAMAAEPTGMAIQGWFKGKEWVEIETKGKAAHPSTPSMGVNAIHHMAEIIHKIRNAGFTYEEHKFLGHCAINFGVIGGGTSINSIPDLCRSNLEVRTVPGQTGKGVGEQINIYINELKKEDATLDASFRVTDRKDPIELSFTDPIFNRIQRASQRAIGMNLNPGKMGVASGDLYYLWKSFGIPGLIFGPGNIGLAHSPNEYVKYEDITAASKCYAGFILEFCNSRMEGDNEKQ